MPKTAIIIKLSKEDDALVYAEKTLGRNKTIQKRAAVIFYASKGAESITELGKKSGCNRALVSRTLKGYAEKGVQYIYEYRRGIKKSILDTIESKLLADFDKNPPASIPETVSRIAQNHGIVISKTPVRYWLKKRGCVILRQNHYQLGLV